MKFNKKSYKKFRNKEDAAAWGKEHYNYWLPKLQDQNYKAKTHKEMFFRGYTQGIHSTYNIILRGTGINNYDFADSPNLKNEIIEGAAEINRNLLSESIVVYRYVSPMVLNLMTTWRNAKSIKRNDILIDKGFFSTTLSLDSVTGRRYAQYKNNSIFKIYVPKDTPCVSVGLVADMNENEMLFAPDIKLKVLNNYSLSRLIECIVVKTS